LSVWPLSVYQSCDEILNDDEPWQQTKAEIEAKGVNCLALPLDVRQPEQPKAVVEQVIARFGAIDILINNASVWLKAPFLEITEAAWNTALSVNLSGPFLLSQAAAPYMLKQERGHIINITDLSAFQTWSGYAHHAASKAGGTVLLPDDVSEEKRQWAIENSLLKRVGSPQDVAKTLLFLTEMDFVTGAVYFVDGGRALV